MTLLWRHIQTLLSRKGAALTGFYVLLVVSLSIAALLVLRTSRSGITEYNKLTEQSIRSSNILLNIRQEADETQASVVRMIFNNEQDDVMEEMEYIREIEQQYQYSWTGCESWLKESTLSELYDSLIVNKNHYLDVTTQLLNRTANNKDNSRAIEFYYSSQMAAYTAYQTSIQYVANRISRHIENSMYMTNAAVASGSNNVNFWLLVSFLVMVAGSVLIMKYHKKLLQVQQMLLAERQQRFREITRQSLNAQERERNEIGRELHDNVNQLLTVAKLNLAFVTERPEKSAELIPKSINYLQDAIQEIRCLCKSLVTPLKNDISLVESLKELLASVQAVSDNIFFTFTSNLTCEKQLDTQLRLNVYRIVQEQVNNILKHANASDVSVSLTNDHNTLTLAIEDNGCGFDTSAHTPGIGVSNIINRVEAFQGTVNFDTLPGDGCTLIVTLPLATHQVKSRSFFRKIAANYF